MPPQPRLRGHFAFMKRIIFFALVIFPFLSVYSLAEDSVCSERRTKTATQRLAEGIAAGPELKESLCGFCAVKVSGDTLLWFTPEKRLVPASNMKLLTTGAALLRLGGNFRYKTVFASEAAPADSVLEGNLYIIGGGDPLIGEIFPYLPSRESTFGKWRKVLTGNGIKAIRGNIVAVGGYFGSERYHPDWSGEDLLSKDGVVPAGITWRGKMRDSIPDGPYAAALHFLEYLSADSSFCIEGQALEGIADSLCKDSLLVLGEVPSEPLRSLTATANGQSDNFVAETLLKTLGKSISGSDDYPSSVKALHKALAPLGLMAASGSMRFADGSGLSRKNYISPSFMVRYLLAMEHSRAGREFCASLPFAGEKRTTLEKRLPKAPYALRSRVRMKSGSMNGVCCLSGYILAGNGKPSDTIAFSLMVNNAVAGNKAVFALLDKIIESLADENK